jgi:hypothetical protein
MDILINLFPLYKTKPFFNKSGPALLQALDFPLFPAI